MAQAKPTIADFMPAAHQWSLDPIVRRMIDILEQRLLDDADPVLRESRSSIAGAIDTISWPLDLICASLGRKHPDRRRLCDAHEQLAELREGLYGLPREAVSRRMVEIAGLLTVAAPQPRADPA